MNLFCAKRASKILVPPEEMLHLFSIGTFLTNYDVTNREHKMAWNILHCMNTNNLRAKEVNGDHYIWLRLKKAIELPSDSLFDTQF